MEQLSMMDLLCPPPPPPAPEPYVEPVHREVMTRAYGRDYPMRIEDGDPDPVEVDVDGTPCLIVFGFWFSAYTVQTPGSLFWSETGFRSFTHGYFDDDLKQMIFVDDLDTAIRLIRHHIAEPIKSGGCGGKLVRWWPSYILRWRDDLSWSIRYPNRAEIWAQWGPEKHAEAWAKHDRRIAEAEARMWAEGIDPNEVGPPQHHKGPWPKITCRAQEKEGRDD